jgi:hypothetical protein
LIVYAPMNKVAFERIGAMIPLLLYVFEIEKARAVRELIQHPRGQLLWRVRRREGHSSLTSLRKRPANIGSAGVTPAGVCRWASKDKRAAHAAAIMIKQKLNKRRVSELAGFHDFSDLADSREWPFSAR